MPEFTVFSVEELTKSFLQAKRKVDYQFKTKKPISFDVPLRQGSLSCTLSYASRVYGCRCAASDTYFPHLQGASLAIRGNQVLQSDWVLTSFFNFGPEGQHAATVSASLAPSPERPSVWLSAGRDAAGVFEVETEGAFPLHWAKGARIVQYGGVQHGGASSEGPRLKLRSGASWAPRGPRFWLEWEPGRGPAPRLRGSSVRAHFSSGQSKDCPRSFSAQGSCRVGAAAGPTLRLHGRQRLPGGAWRLSHRLQLGGGQEPTYAGEVNLACPRSQRRPWRGRAECRGRLRWGRISLGRGHGDSKGASGCSYEGGYDSSKGCFAKVDWRCGEVSDAAFRECDLQARVSVEASMRFSPGRKIQIGVPSLSLFVPL